MSEPTPAKAAAQTASQPKKGPSAEATRPAPSTSADARPGDDYNSVDFSGFVVSLATQAMVLLGEMAHPQTNTVMVDLEGARQTIDIIAILEQKTKGNLTAEEARLLTEVLASLRLAFVNKTRRGPTSK